MRDVMKPTLYLFCMTPIVEREGASIRDMDMFVLVRTVPKMITHVGENAEVTVSESRADKSIQSGMSRSGRTREIIRYDGTLRCDIQEHKVLLSLSAWCCRARVM